MSVLLGQITAYEIVEWVAWFDMAHEENASPMTYELTPDQQYAQMRRVLG